MNKFYLSILQRLLQNDPTLKTLDLSRRNLDDNDIKLLAQALSSNTALQTLDISYNKIGDEGIKALAANAHVTTLAVTYNNITAEGAKALAANVHITTLYINANEVGDKGAKALANNTRITTLAIDAAKIGDEGAEALAANKHIKTLNINLNNVGAEGAKALAANMNISTLNINLNNVGAEGAKAFLNNTQLTQLNISNNNIPPHLEAQLYKAVTLNRKAKQLRFTEHLIEIAKAARYHRTDSLFPLLPSDILKIILAYVAVNAAQDPQAVMPVCNLVLSLIRGSGNNTSGKPALQWSDACASKFFKPWDPVENEAVRSRMVKPVVNEESNAGQHLHFING